jgi:hypothetical protein
MPYIMVMVSSSVLMVVYTQVIFSQELDRDRVVCRKQDLLTKEISTKMKWMGRET